MNHWRFFLPRKRFYTAAMFLLAAALFIVFSTANGNETSTGTNETPINAPVLNTSRTGTGNGVSETSEPDVKPESGNSVPSDKPDEMSVPTRPERMMSIGIRKIYAPEADVQQWPLGNKSFSYINAQEFELKYKLWKEHLSDLSSDSHLTAPDPEVFIESARYCGTAYESGELSGWGEWKIKKLTIGDEQLATRKQDVDSKKKSLSLILASSSLNMLLTDFVFYDASVENLPDPENGSKSECLSPLQPDSETRFPVEKGVVSASLPNGQTVLFIPSEGTVRFRWKVKRLELNDYLIQSLGSVESLWTIDVPLDKKLTLRPVRSDVKSKPLCASVTKEKNEESNSWRYSIRWSESETAIVHIGLINEKDRFDRFYKQQTAYTFSPYDLTTQCSITFEPDSRSELPQEIPFTVVHDPRVNWEASLNGQPAEIIITETGYSVSLKKYKTDNPRPELLITSRCSLADVNREVKQTNNENDSSSSDLLKLLLPRIDLQSGRWQSGTAVIYTQQSPVSIETTKCSVVDSTRDVSRSFQTTIEQESSDSDLVLVIEPYKELFYSQIQTVVQWDGSQASFISSIDLYAEEGGLYTLTAALPEGLTIDQAFSEQQPKMVENWEVYADPDNPAKRTLTIYLRKSLCPGQSLDLVVRSHAIADWSKPIELNRLSPIAFDQFETHAEQLYVNVAVNQRFIVGDRVLYSPEQRLSTSEDELLPVGIECTPHTSSGMETGRIDAYEFNIDLMIWGDYLASLEPIQSEYTVDAKTTIWVDKNTMEERIELAFSGERTHLNQFHFSFGHSSENSCSWQGLLIWSNNQYKVKVEPMEGNVFSIDIPRNVSSPFTIILSRKFDWNQKRAFEVLESKDCSRLTSSVSVFSRTPQLFEIHAYGMKYVKSAADDNADFIIGSYEYESRNQSLDARTDNDGGPLASDGGPAPRIEISACKKAPSDVSIWAWNQHIEERHFASGNVLTSAQWTIENRFPPQDYIHSSDASNTCLQITLPTDLSDSSDLETFLTGVEIDNESVSGENIIQKTNNTYIILLPPKKKFFVLTVQWTSYNRPLKNYCIFKPQKPVLSVPVLQSSWNLYYPASYRRMNSFLSYDSSVDGWLERFLGPLLRRDSAHIMKFVSSNWDDGQNGNQSPESRNRDLGNRDLELLNKSALSANMTSGSPMAFSIPEAISGYSAWSGCQFAGYDAPETVWVIRSEVSECIRWLFFILSISVILTLYFKRSDKQEDSNANSQIQSLNGDALVGKSQNNKNSSSVSWGFRRWVCIFGGICGILCQTLPWFLSLAFSGVFLGTLVCLLVMAAPLRGEMADNNEGSASGVKGSTTVKLNSHILHPTSRLLIFVVLLILQPAMGQTPVLPPPTSGFRESGSVENREYEIFVPIDQQNQPKSGYYVPQELLNLMQTRENNSLERSWIICRAQYFGKLVQKPRQTESVSWKCLIEIESLASNVYIDVPIPLQTTVSATSNISVSRGRILKSSNSKTDQENEESAKNETLYWSWDKLDNHSILQWNSQNERWGIRLPQPGRYLIEVEFRPTIVSVNGKSEISFSIQECLNSTFELLVSDNITGLEFPGAFGDVKEMTTDISDPSIPLQSGMLLKRVQLGAAKQLVVRWNAGGFLSDGPVYDVDTITWWNVLPDSVDVKIKYNVKVVSGSVSSVKLNADERLELINEPSINAPEIPDDVDNSNDNELKIQTASPEMENPGEKNGESDSTISARNSVTMTNSDGFQPGVRYTVVSNPDKPGEITVKFNSPITSQASFELGYKWKDAHGVGRLQFPTTSVVSSRSGQRIVAFTFDSRLQHECISESLMTMSAQSFLEQWRGFQKQTAPVLENETASTDPGNAGNKANPASNNNVMSDSSARQNPRSALPQTTSNLPTVAYDLNLSRRKNDPSGVVDSIVMNVQRTKASSEGTSEAFVLVDWNRLFWQYKWSVNITHGERSSYSAVLPESMCKPENHLTIISAFVDVLDKNSNQSFPVSACIEGNELKLYWGTPIEGKCELTVRGEIRPEFENESSSDLRKINFDFPEIQTLNVTQYKLAIARKDDSAVKTIFDKPTPKTVAWMQVELSVDSPYSSRNQRLLETWQAVISDTSKKPCAFALEIQKNDVAAEIDASVKKNGDSLVINGRVKVANGILDEFLLDIPENCMAPISSKTTLKCELDKMSINQRRYILRPLSPFISDSDFELTIPLKNPESGSWKLEKQGAALWSVVRAGSSAQTNEQTSGQNNDVPAPSMEQTQKPAAEHSSAPVTNVFGLKMFVKPISESEYCASAEFACAVSGTDSVLVRLPKGSKALNVQMDRSSIRWIEKTTDEILIPMLAENDPVDIRIVYTSSFNRTIYTEPMKFEPPLIENAQQPSILWMVLPWKNFSNADHGSVRLSTFINKQNWLINDLKNQFQFLQTTGNISLAALERLSDQLDEIESQFKQYEYQGNKKSNSTNSRSKNNADNNRNQNLTSTETGSIRLAEQSAFLLRKAIASVEKQEKKDSGNNYRGIGNRQKNSKMDWYPNEELEFQSLTKPALVGLGVPKTAFVLTYSLPPSAAPSASIWQMLSLLFIPVIIWLTFFPPKEFILWRPSFVLGCLSVVWLLCFNLYYIGIFLFIAAVFDALNKLRHRSQRNIIPLKVQ